jgi:hypothetical protein
MNNDHRANQKELAAIIKYINTYFSNDISLLLLSQHFHLDAFGFVKTEKFKNLGNETKVWEVSLDEWYGFVLQAAK